MANQDTNRRQEIYDKIRESSKDEFILSEMKRLGFWKEDKDKPSLPAQFIKEESELTKELRELYEKQRKLENKEAFLKESRKKRMEESRKKQQETKERKKRERQEKAERWAQYKTLEIPYLGAEYSNLLSKREYKSDNLNKYQLPVFNSIIDLANSMGISVNELRFLAYSRKTSKTNHYKRFYVNKKSGGKRMISAPMPRLKKAQEWILTNILNKVEINNAANGFVQNRSILSNATPHVEQDVVINMDLKNFFPTITYERVLGVFKNLGYSGQFATIFALLCTEPDVAEIELDKETYFVAKSKRYLPQGAPSSPAITNIVCRKLDNRLNGLAESLGFSYTRYADDITFSGSDIKNGNIKKVLAASRKFIQEENFVVHPEKTKVMHKGRKQEVTGIVVNKKVSVSRKKIKQFRALLFQIEKDGLEGKSWNGKTNGQLLPSLKGYSDFLKMVNPVKFENIHFKAQEILTKHNYKHEIKYPNKSQKATKTNKEKVGAGKQNNFFGKLKKLFGG